MLDITIRLPPANQFNTFDFLFVLCKTCLIYFLLFLTEVMHIYVKKNAHFCQKNISYAHACGTKDVFLGGSGVSLEAGALSFKLCNITSHPFHNSPSYYCLFISTL